MSIAISTIRRLDNTLFSLPPLLKTCRETYSHLPWLFLSLTVATCDDPNRDVVIEGFGWDGVCLSFIVDRGNEHRKAI